MRKLLILVITAFFCILAVGCDSGLEIAGMEIEKYPDKIVYFSGIDNELDLTGGVIKYIHKEKSEGIADMDGRHITISHNIDFNKPGVYVVELKRHVASCEFPIQVIELPKNTDQPK